MFIRVDSFRRLLSLGMACAVLEAGTALAHTMTAPNSPSAQNEWKGAAAGLGSSHRFPTIEAAQAHCSGDVIVWSDGYHLTYYLPGSKQYGKTQDGFYTCRSEADDAGFHAASD